MRRAAARCPPAATTHPAAAEEPARGGAVFPVMPSTAIRRFDYDAQTRALDIRFVSGRIYRYFDVPETLADRMRAASSKGAFFNAELRDRYRFARLH